MTDLPQDIKVDEYGGFELYVVTRCEVFDPYEGTFTAFDSVKDARLYAKAKEKERNES